MRLLLLPLMLAAFAACPVSAQSDVQPAENPATQSLALIGADGLTVPLSREAIAALPRVTITFDAHGVSHVYEGPLLMDVLKAVGAPSGRQLRGPALASVVLVTAADGYQVAYGLAETDPATRPNRIILADRADGAPLSPEAGPFQIVVEGDLRPARSVRQVVTLEVRSLSTSRSANAAH